MRISISLPYLVDTEIIEPGAASVEKRLENSINIKAFPNLSAILYLRPFNQQMVTNQKAHVDIINSTFPQGKAAKTIANTG